MCLQERKLQPSGFGGGNASKEAQSGSEGVQLPIKNSESRES